MEKQPLDRLIERLERLEREKRRRRATAAAICVGAFLFTLGGARLPENAKVIEASGFSVRGGDGKARASFSVDSSGLAVLQLFDQAGKSRLGFGIEGDGSPSLMLYDDYRKASIGLFFQQDMTPTLMGVDKDGKVRAELSVWERASPFLGFYEKQGRARTLLMRQSAFDLNDQHGKPRCYLEVGDDGLVAILLRDEKEKLRMLLDGGARLWLNDSDEKRRLTFGLVQGLPALRFTDGNGHGRIAMNVAPNGQAGIYFLEEAQSFVRFSTCVDSNRVPTLFMKRDDKSPLLEMTEKPEGVPMLTFVDRERRILLQIPAP
jgi:hypothetical protein